METIFDYIREQLLFEQQTLEEKGLIKKAIKKLTRKKRSPEAVPLGRNPGDFRRQSQTLDRLSKIYKQAKYGS